MGEVMGRHGWTGKTPQIACNPNMYKTQSFVCVLDRQGGVLTCPCLTGLEQICLDIR